MKKPANPVPTTGAYSTVRVSEESRESLDTIRSALQEWFLQHPSEIVRRQALSLSLDKTLRIVLASFARDYRIPLEKHA